MWASGPAGGVTQFSVKSVMFPRVRAPIFTDKSCVIPGDWSTAVHDSGVLLYQVSFRHVCVQTAHTRHVLHSKLSLRLEQIQKHIKPITHRRGHDLHYTAYGKSTFHRVIWMYGFPEPNRNGSRLLSRRDIISQCTCDGGSLEPLHRPQCRYKIWLQKCRAFHSWLQQEESRIWS